MTLRQEVEVHEIHAESDYDEEDDGQVGGAVAVEPFENLPHPSLLLVMGLESSDTNFDYDPPHIITEKIREMDGIQYYPLPTFCCKYDLVAAIHWL